MSELKATTAQEIVRKEKDCDYMDELFDGVKMPPTQVYIKSEADKEILKLKEENERLKATPEQIMKEVFDKCLIYPKEMVRLDDAYKLAVSLRKQKYKRCLAMAKECVYGEIKLKRVKMRDMNNHQFWQFDNDYWQKWNNRWLKIAEKFKDKETK